MNGVLHIRHTVKDVNSHSIFWLQHLSFSSPSRLKHHRPKSAGACSNPSWSLQALHVLLIGFIKRIPVLSTSLSLPAACSSTRPITTGYLESTSIWEGSHMRCASLVLPEESEKCYLRMRGESTRVGVIHWGSNRSVHCVYGVLWTPIQINSSNFLHDWRG